MTIGGVTFGSDRLTRGAGLTGAADSKTGIISFWIKPGAGTNVENYFFQTGLGYLIQRRGAGASNPLGMRLKNSAGTTIWNREQTGFTSATYTDWTHVAFAWDLATTTVHYYINGSSAGSDVTAPVNDTVAYATNVTNWALGADESGGSSISADIADFYFAPGQYLDLSVAANLQKFRGSSGKAVDLGADGSTPTGTAPLVLFHIDAGEAVANFATNRGTGGAFTLAGTLAASATNPPQDVHGALAVTLADTTLSSAAAIQIKAAFSKTLADATLSATGIFAGSGQLSQTLANLTLSSASTLKIAGTLSKTLANATLSSAATVKIVGALAVTLANTTLSSAAAVQIRAALARTLADASLSAAAQAKIQATLAATLDDATLASIAASIIHGDLSVTLEDAVLIATGNDGWTRQGSAGGTWTNVPATSAVWTPQRNYTITTR